MVESLALAHMAYENTPSMFGISLEDVQTMQRDLNLNSEQIWIFEYVVDKIEEVGGFHEKLLFT